MTVMEKVGIFVNTMAWGASLRDSCERFQRSTSSLSEAITDVLEALVGRNRGWNGLARDVIRPVDPTFSEVPKQISEDGRYSRYFKVITTSLLLMSLCSSLENVNMQLLPAGMHRGPRRHTHRSCYSA